MHEDWLWFILVLLALGLFAIAILTGEIFPNPHQTWSIRIIVLLVILGLIGLYRRKD